jgi:hypothetical protein
LARAIGAELHEALNQAKQTGHSARQFKAFTYPTRKTWSPPRRVVAKVRRECFIPLD